MPITINSLNESGGGQVQFGYSGSRAILAGLHRTLDGDNLLSSTAVLDAWPEMHGRTIRTEINVKTGRVRVLYQDPPHFVDGQRVEPPEVVAFEADLARPEDR